MTAGLVPVCRMLVQNYGHVVVLCYLALIVHKKLGSSAGLSIPYYLYITWEKFCTIRLYLV